MTRGLSFHPLVRHSKPAVKAILDLRPSTLAEVSDATPPLRAANRAGPGTSISWVPSGLLGVGLNPAVLEAGSWLCAQGFLQAQCSVLRVAFGGTGEPCSGGRGSVLDLLTLSGPCGSRLQFCESVLDFWSL